MRTALEAGLKEVQHPGHTYHATAEFKRIKAGSVVLHSCSSAPRRTRVTSDLW
jgi:hypothetical protein